MILCFLIATSAMRADVLSDPWPRKIRDFPEWVTVADNLPIAFTKGSFRITISQPSHSSIREEGGSGGPMLAFTIRDQKSGWKTTFYDQCVNGALLQAYHGRPQFEIWGRGGGGYFARELVRFTQGAYRSVRVDQFTADKSRATNTLVTATLPRDDLTLYFLESIVPDGSKL